MAFYDPLRPLVSTPGNHYHIPIDGIYRVVINADIHIYLGIQAIVHPSHDEVGDHARFYE